MSATNSSRHFQVLLRRVRKSALAFPSISYKLQAVPCCSTRQAPAAAAFSTSAITRNLEQSPLGNASEPSALLHPTLKTAPLNVVAAKGTTVTFSNGKKMEDTTCGAAVACIGYDNERVKTSMIKQMDNFSYSNSMFYGHQMGEELAAELIRGTNGEMSKVYLMCSGTLSHFLFQVRRDV
jgi:4-aminobutyrate aminotransferase-like enzyme